MSSSHSFPSLQFPLHLHSKYLPPSTSLPSLLTLNLKTNLFPASLSSSPNPLLVNKQCIHRHANSFTAMAKSPRTDSSEQKWTYEGSVVESLPNGVFRVRLDNEDLILGYISGKIRKNFVRILPGDRVRVEVSRYDSTRGRIVYRMRSGAKE